jgi:hypothetical protein
MTEALAKYQAANDPKMPLEGMGYHDSEEVLVRVADAVLEALNGVINAEPLGKSDAQALPGDSIPYAIAVPGKPNLVRSPYLPDKFFDISGYGHGSKVLDPYTGRPCMVP